MESGIECNVASHPDCVSLTPANVVDGKGNARSCLPLWVRFLLPYSELTIRMVSSCLLPESSPLRDWTASEAEILAPQPSVCTGASVQRGRMGEHADETPVRVIAV